MTVEHGILIGSDVLPGTERVVRDSDAWWQHGEVGTRPRQGHRVDRLVGHWTAGHPRTGPTAGPRVVRAMKARKRPDGSRMDVGIHCVISWDGIIWQTADLAQGTVHVGNRTMNARSIGVECCWPGTVEQARKLGVEVEHVAIGQAHGKRIRCLPPSDELLAAWAWLARALTDARHPLMALPMKRGSMSAAGVLEHCDVTPTTKIDAAGLLVDALGLR
jgi:hypothetical protein